MGVAQAPPTHGVLVHAVPPTQPPLVLQLCGVLPMHVVCPGAHEPLQTPPTQVWLVHATGFPHAPAALQVSTPLGAPHCLFPGEHATQVLFRHAGVGAEHVVCVCQPPLVLHD
jgi:hypothetical protein